MGTRALGWRIRLADWIRSWGHSSKLALGSILHALLVAALLIIVIPPPLPFHGGTGHPSYELAYLGGSGSQEGVQKIDPESIDWQSTVSRDWSRGDNSRLPLWVVLLELWCFLWFLSEFVCKWLTRGFWSRKDPTTYLRSVWNRVDLFLVLVGCVSVLSSVWSRWGLTEAERLESGFPQLLRWLGVLQLLRLMKPLSRISLLALLFLTCLRSVRKLVHLVVLVILFVMFLGVVGVQLYSGTLRQRCFEINTGM